MSVNNISRSEQNSNKSISTKSANRDFPIIRKNADRSETSKKASVSMKDGVKSNRYTSDKNSTIKLIHSKGRMVVAVSDFVQVSQVIKQRYEEGRMTSAVELKEYSDKSVQILAIYIEKREFKANVSFYVLAELLRLAKCFVMEDFTKQLEDVLLVASSHSAENCIQGILVTSVASVNQETERSLVYSTAWRFLEVARHPSFKDIPLTSFLNLLGSCELNVTSELNVVDASLLWLSTQNHVDKAASAVFSMIRSVYLTKVDRQMILERIAILRFPEAVGRFARIALDSRHNNRVCLEQAHISRHLVRCGFVDHSKGHEAILPLSRPGQGVCYAKGIPAGRSYSIAIFPEQEKNSSRRVTRGEKSSKSQASKKKSTKSEKSKRCKKPVKKQGFFSRLFRNNNQKSQKTMKNKKSVVKSNKSNKNLNSNKSTKSNKSANSSKKTVKL